MAGIEIQQPLINGIYPTHSEITVFPQIGGTPLGLSLAAANATSALNQVTGIPLKGQLGVRELNYTQQMQPTLVYANDAAPIGRTRGQYSAAASIGMLIPQYLAFIGLLKTAAGVNAGYGEIAFNMSIQYLLGDAQVSFVQTELIGCRIGHETTSSSAGSQDPITMTADLNPMFIKVNSILLFSGSVAASQQSTAQQQ